MFFIYCFRKIEMNKLKLNKNNSIIRTMDLIQRKLTKSEWEGIEVPVSDDEKEILKLIKSGYNNVNIRYNNNPSLIGYMKIDVSRLVHSQIFMRLNSVMLYLKSHQ